MTAYRLFDRLPLATTIALCRTFPDGMLKIVGELPPDAGLVVLPAWEGTREVDKIMRARPGVVRGERSA